MEAAFAFSTTAPVPWTNLMKSSNTPGATRSLR